MFVINAIDFMYTKLSNPQNCNENSATKIIKRLSLLHAHRLRPFIIFHKTKEREAL